MRILVDHGALRNLGDIAMIEAVVARLRRLLPQAELFVIDRGALPARICDHRQVFAQEVYAPQPLWRASLARVPLLWRYEESWGRAVSRLSLQCLGTLVPAGSLSLWHPKQKENQAKTLREFCEPFDALHVVGGGNLTDLFYGQLYARCCLIWTFAELHKPVILTGQQLGPFTSYLSKKALARALRMASFVGLRESGDSLKFCEEARLNPECFQVMGDDSFGLPTDKARVCELLAQYGLQGTDFLAVNVHYAPEHAQHLQNIATITDRVAREAGMPVLIVPIAFTPSDNDVTFGRNLAEALRVANVVVMEENGLTPALVKGILGKAFGAIGVSYHFCTFALSQGVPAICLYDGNYYAQKAGGLCSFWQDERLAIPLRKLDPEATAARISQVLEDPSLRKKLCLLAEQARTRWEALFDRRVNEIFGRLCQKPSPLLLSTEQMKEFVP